MEAFAMAYEVVTLADRGGATTLTVALVRGDELYVAKVEDCPFYSWDAKGFRVGQGSWMRRGVHHPGGWP